MTDKAAGERALDKLTTNSLYKYRQRSLDNLKRVYAVTLSISIGKFLENIYGNAAVFLHENVEKNASSITLADNILFLQFAMLIVLIATLSVFYFNEDKLIDIAYGFDPTDAEKLALRQNDKTKEVPDQWKFLPFSVYYIIVLLTLLPFSFLGLAGRVETLKAVGLKDFFIGYVALLAGTSVLASINEFIVRFSPMTAASDTARGRILSTNWRIVNSSTVILLTLGYMQYWPHFRIDSTMSCPISAVDCVVPRPFDGWAAYTYERWFLWSFLFIAMLRNYLDIRGTWPFLIINQPYDINRNPCRDEDFSKFTLTYILAVLTYRARESNQCENTKKRARGWLQLANISGYILLGVAVFAVVELFRFGH